MVAFSAERRVRHAAEQMFDLVADCEAYPEFVPHCQKLVVTGRDRADGKEVLIADMTVTYGPASETFTTRDVLDREGMTIDVAYLNGPFRHFEGRWRFESDGSDASLVRFAIDYEFRSRVLAGLIGPVVKHSFHQFVDAFVARADKLYPSSA